MHEGEYAPSKARLSVESYYDDHGRDIKYKEAICILCGLCVKNCPKEAITMTDKIAVDHEKCIGCKTCLKVCPTKAVRYNEKGKSVICDTCDGAPICVEICPHSALSYK